MAALRCDGSMESMELQAASESEATAAQKEFLMADMGRSLLGPARAGAFECVSIKRSLRGRVPRECAVLQRNVRFPAENTGEP